MAMRKKFRDTLEALGFEIIEYHSDPDSWPIWGIELRNNGAGRLNPKVIYLEHTYPDGTATNLKWYINLKKFAGNKGTKFNTQREALYHIAHNYR